MSETSQNSDSFQEAALALLDALYGYAMSLTRDRPEAEDLVQETYLRAALAVHRPEPGNILKAWLFTILRNVWINRVRHARAGPQFVSLDADESLGPRLGEATTDPQVVHLRQSEGEAVRAAIQRLPPLQREVVVLRDLEGFSYKEIAEILACPVGTVMSRLGRARERLREWLGEWNTKSPEKTAPGQSSK